jgi:hypothetical protein
MSLCKASHLAATDFMKTSLFLKEGELVPGLCVRSNCMSTNGESNGKQNVRDVPEFLRNRGDGRCLVYCLLDA